MTPATHRFEVNGMTCGHCVRAVTQAIHAIDATAPVDVDLATKIVRVASTADAAALAAAIRDAGYEAQPVASA